MLPTTVSGTDLANLCGVTPDRIRHLATAGVIPRSGRDQYPLIDSIRAYTAYLRRHQGDPASGQLNPQQEKALLDQARREQVQLQTAERRKELVPRVEVIDTWSRALAVLRQRLLTAPTKLAPLLLAVSDAREAEAVIRTEIHGALTELAAFPAAPD